jgi:hypothetical protein
MLQSTVPPRWNDDEIPSRTTVADALRCPFPLQINQHVQAAHEHSLRWVKRLYFRKQSVWQPPGMSR